MDPLIELTGMAKGFGTGEARVQALSDITLSVVAGEVVGLRGPSGSGKSTLLNLVACILEPDAGRMSLAGEAIWEKRWLRRDLRALRRQKIGFIFQFHNLLPFLDATDNVALAMTLNGMALPEARRRARELLDYLQVGRRADAMPAKLSGGEAHRTAASLLQTGRFYVAGSAPRPA